MYRLPLEYSIDNLKYEVHELEAQVESAKEHLDNMTSKYVNSALNKGRGKQCSNCHLRLDHNIRQCTIDKCMTSEQCADVSKHPEEKQILDAASYQLKKLERELKSKINEYDTRMKGLQSTRTSFPQQIRGPLINSNQSKYLMKTSDGMFVPRSALVNMDIAKLEKYFKGKVPSNVESIAKTFKTIIDNFDKETIKPKLCPNRNPAKKDLETNNLFPVKFPWTTATVTSASGSSDDQVMAFNSQPSIVPSIPMPLPSVAANVPFQNYQIGMPVVMYQGDASSLLGQQTVWIVPTTDMTDTTPSTPLPPKKRHST